MELMEAIHRRQSIRRFKEQDVPKEALEQMFEAARHAPSGKNIQNWHFIAIKDRVLMDRIAETILVKNETIATEMERVDEEKALRFRKFVKNFTLFYLKAPVLVVVFTKDYLPSGYHELELTGAHQAILDDILLKRNPGMQNLGAAIEHFTLSAVEQGFGSCWLTSANYAAKEIEDLLEKEIGFAKEGWFMGAMLALGVPEDGAKSPKKKPLEEICTFIGF